MNVTIGKRLGSFEISSVLGRGGMGEVWRATDERLDREVALKVLPEDFAEDPERHARFEREAKVLGSLNHTNIATLYGLEHLEDRHVLVMELVEGEGLDELMARGPIAIEEAIPIALQIAAALETAHSQGIVHRDLKPANIRIRPDGTVKVLDFGLAKSWETQSADGNLSVSPTITSLHTQAGLILGTAAYMSPEQARGKPVDKQSDIWAFGVLLFEMLAGRKLFEGEVVTEVLADVLRSEIDLTVVAAHTPAPMLRLLRRCLERNPKNRLHDIADARIVIEELADGHAEGTPRVAQTGTRAPRSRRMLGWLAAFALGAAAAFVLLRLGQPGPEAESPAAPRASFKQLTFLAGAEEAPAMAPDGESFAYVREVDGQRDIFLQRVAGSRAINLTAGCEADDGEPAFSPDGRRIAYASVCSGGGIFVMGATGESARKVTDSGHNPAWSPDGLELAIADERLGLPFGRTTSSRIWAVNIETGERRLLTEHDGVEPSWSPDGGRIAFWGLPPDSSARDLYTVAADGSQSDLSAAVAVQDDAAVDWSPVWSADGRALIFASTRGGTMNLWRIGIDPVSGRPAGEPQPVTVPSSWAGYLSASADGRRLAFVDRNVRTAIKMADFDPVAGALAGPARSLALGTIEVHETLALTPTGDRVLFASAGMPQHLYMTDTQGGLRQLTDGFHRDRQGTFSPDGKWIVFQTDRWPSRFALIRPDGSGLRQLATGIEESAWYPLFSPDGRWLAFSSLAGPNRMELAGSEGTGLARPLAPRGDDLAFSPTSWSPDSRQLLGTLSSRSNIPVGVEVYTFADQSYRRISEGLVMRAIYLPDGRRVLLVQPDRIELLDVESGETRLVATASEGARILWGELTPDGRRLAWREQADESDLWLASFDAGL